MTIANEKTLRDLEFDRVRSLVGSYASSSLGEEAVAGLLPIDDRETIEEAMGGVREAVAFLNRHGRFSLGAVSDLVSLLERARETSVLDAEQLLAVRRSLEATLEVRDVLTADDEDGRLARLGRRLSEQTPLLRSLRVAIDEGGELRNDASPELARLTRELGTLEKRVNRRLQSVIDRHPELLSDPVVTFRKGRLVLPIRSGSTGAMSFVVHDRSATGQTLYAEPTDLVPDNNRITETASAIRDERARILRELTEKVCEREAALRRDRAILAHVDSLFARAAYARDRGCSFPQFGERVVLREARHPLLPREHVVPISLALGGTRRMAVITGPNTGGKTVTLKTVGLFSLMVQAGIPVPASPDSEVMIVSRVRSDIGDEQSIEQSLSTFSAHMRNLVSLLAEADRDTLVLLDELGAGTDPQEGAALGLAILDALLAREALVLVSTHLTPLKYFAIRHPAVTTASMEFDAASLAPTFRVVDGVPGRSNAFLIAQGLGLPQPLIDRARSFLSQGEIRADDIIDELQRERRLLEARRREAERARDEADRREREAREQVEAFAADREATLSARSRDTERFLRESQREAEEIVARLRAENREGAASAHAKRLASMREELASRRKTRAVDTGGRLSADDLRPGTAVYIRSLEANGRVQSAAADGEVVVDMDGVRVRTNVADLAAPREDSRRRPPPRSPRLPFAPGQVPLELNVRGMTINEALRELERYLDRLLRADIQTARILHGKGTGALREAIRGYLASLTYVASYGSPPPNQGGDGVTTITMRAESP